MKAKTLLRYPGGKSRAVSEIMQYFPEDLKTLVSPFLGGGAIELECARRGIRVYGYDSFNPLITFWKYVINSPELLSEEVEKYHPLDKSTFYKLQKTQMDIEDSMEKAAVFYVLNRSSFSGATLSGGMSPGHPRFNEASINRLAKFKIQNLSVECLDFKDSIEKHPDDFLYLDPPYLTHQKLYGNKGSHHKSFDHQGLADILKKRKGWVLSYNNCQEVRELYKDYKIIEPKWAYGMGKDKSSKELLIINID